MIGKPGKGRFWVIKPGSKLRIVFDEYFEYSDEKELTILQKIFQFFKGKSNGFRSKITKRN